MVKMTSAITISADMLAPKIVEMTSAIAISAAMLAMIKLIIAITAIKVSISGSPSSAAKHSQPQFVQCTDVALGRVFVISPLGFIAVLPEFNLGFEPYDFLY